MRMLIACSSGGHLTQAMALREVWEPHERLWVTSPAADAREKLRGEHVVEMFHPTIRSVRNLARNTVLARRVLASYRPDVVLSTGAAIAVPFLTMAGHYGARSVYLEAVDRTDRPSLSGLLVYPFVDEFLVQWEELRRTLPVARHVGVIL